MKTRDSPYDQILFLCTKGDCKKRGAKEFRRKIRAAQRERGVGKKRLRIQACGCLNDCDRGPNAVLSPGGRWFSGLHARDAEALLDEILANGE